MTPAHSRTALTLAPIVCMLCTTVAFAQSTPARGYPDRPVRLIVPYPPGGGSDVIARMLAPKMSEGLGQQVVIDNRAGAATIIGLDMLAKSPPNGYTFGIATSTLAVNTTLNKSLPFDTLRDFAPVMLAADGLYVLVVHPGVAGEIGARSGRAQEKRARQAERRDRGFGHADAHGARAIQLDGRRRASPASSTRARGLRSRRCWAARRSSRSSACRRW